MIAYTVLSPADVTVTTVCPTIDDALELAEIDLLRNWLPVSLVDRRRRWDIERIVTELEAWRERRQNETPPRVAGLLPDLAEVA
jgi:hypothetical protein